MIQCGDGTDSRAAGPRRIWRLVEKCAKTRTKQCTWKCLVFSRDHNLIID